MRTYDDMQKDFTEITKDYLRRELGKDFYGGKVQALIVTTNSVTGMVNIDTCNVNLTGDAKKLLMEAYLQLERSQMANAIVGLMRKELASHENAIRSLLTEGDRKKEPGTRSKGQTKVPRDRKRPRRRAR